MRAGELGVAIVAEDEDALTAQFGRDVPEQEQRRLVRPVQVVEHDQQRGIGDVGAQQVRVRLEQPELRGVGVEDVGRRDVVRLLAEAGEDARELGAVAGVEAVGDAVEAELLRVAVARLHPRPVGWGAGGLVGAPPDHATAAHACVGFELEAGARLADAGLADDHRDRAMARERLVEGGAQAVELGLPADEGAAGEAVERVGLRVGVGGGAGLRIDGLQGLEDLGGRRGAVGRDLGEEAEDERLEVWRAVLCVPAGGDGLGVEVLGDDGGGGVALEGRTTGDELVEHGAEGVEVCLRGDLLAERLLRGHVAVGADHHAVAGEAGLADGDGESEVADLGGAVRGEPDVAGLEVAVDDALSVSELQASGGGDGDVQGLLEGERAGGVLEEAFDVTAAHQLLDEVGLLRSVGGDVFADVVDGDDVGVGEASHGAGLAHDAFAADVVEALGLDEGEGDVAIEECVVGEEDALLAALAEEAEDLIAAAGEGFGVLRRGIVGELDETSGGRFDGARDLAGGGGGAVAVGGGVRAGHLEEGGSVLVGGIDGEDGAGFLGDGVPGPIGDGGVGLVEQGIDAALDAFAGHNERDTT